MPSASVLDLTACAVANRFTVRDRMELGRWTEQALLRHGDRLVLHERLDGDPSDVGNYVAVYSAGCGWASWGLSRRLGGIVVWNSVSGLDSGRFTSLHEALCWVMDHRSDTIHGRPRPASPEQDKLSGHLQRDSCTIARRAIPALVEGVGFEPT